jgi:hypothetical protein
MARKLNTFVTVHRRDNQGELTGESGTFGPDDKLPDWAAKAIKNPDVWEGSDDLDEQVAASPAPDATLPDGGGAEVPPRSGPGSGAPVWREYATSQGISVADDASRDEVISALKSAGKPVE